MPPTECIYQVSNWYLKACWRKVRKTRTDGRTDGQTDRRTLPRHNTSRFSNGRIKTNVWWLVPIAPRKSLCQIWTETIFKAIKCGRYFEKISNMCVLRLVVSLAWRVRRRALAFVYTRYYLTPGNGRLIEPAAINKLISFPPKSAQSRYNPHFGRKWHQFFL